METNLPAQLYTSRGKYGVQITLDDVPGMISYFNPELRETVIIGKNGNLAIAKHGWFFSDFWVSDAINSPPLWRHKLTLYKSDGRKLDLAASAWQR